MVETRERYYQSMHELGKRQILLMECGCDWPHLSDPPFKLPGHTEHRNKFLNNRNLIAKRYFLAHKLIRNIVTKAGSLPEYLCDFGKYRAVGYLELPKYFGFFINF